MPFPFESLTTYQRSLDLVDQTTRLCKQLSGKVPYPFLDQWTRAALSVPLNIAEGYGRWHKKEKIQFFRIAKGSIYEIVPILQVLQKQGHLTSAEYQQTYDLLDTLIKMLTGLIKSIEGRNSEE